MGKFDVWEDEHSSLVVHECKELGKNFVVETENIDLYIICHYP